jgi:hypothetical protein
MARSAPQDFLRRRCRGRNVRLTTETCLVLVFTEGQRTKGNIRLIIRSLVGGDYQRGGTVNPIALAALRLMTVRTWMAPT